MRRLHQQDNAADSYHEVDKPEESDSMQAPIACSAEQNGRNEAGQGKKKIVGDRSRPKTGKQVSKHP